MTSKPMTSKPMSSKPETSKPTILFVDDEERILRTLEMSFRHIFNVITTTDGYEALKL